MDLDLWELGIIMVGSIILYLLTDSVRQGYNKEVEE